MSRPSDCSHSASSIPSMAVPADPCAAYTAAHPYPRRLQRQCLSIRNAAMTDTLLDSRDLAFVLYEVLDAEELTQRQRVADHEQETFDAALPTARQSADKYFAPQNRKNDQNEPEFVDGRAVV